RKPDCRDVLSASRRPFAARPERVRERSSEFRTGIAHMVCAINDKTWKHPSEKAKFLSLLASRYQYSVAENCPGPSYYVGERRLRLLKKDGRYRHEDEREETQGGQQTEVRRSSPQQ